MSDKQENKNIFAEKAIAKTRGNIFGYFITHCRVVILLIISIFIMGAFSVGNIDQESDPEVKIPIAVVSTFYPGASPSDVESLITDELENKIEELDNVKRVTSASRTSISSITVEFEAEANLDDSITELREKKDKLVKYITEVDNDSEYYKHLTLESDNPDYEQFYAVSGRIFSILSQEIKDRMGAI